jgi:hypothetical protein
MGSAFLASIGLSTMVINSGVYSYGDNVLGILAMSWIGGGLFLLRTTTSICTPLFGVIMTIVMVIHLIRLTRQDLATNVTWGQSFQRLFSIPYFKSVVTFHIIQVFFNFIWIIFVNPLETFTLIELWVNPSLNVPVRQDPLPLAPIILWGNCSISCVAFQIMLFKVSSLKLMCCCCWKATRLNINSVDYQADYQVVTHEDRHEYTSELHQLVPKAAQVDSKCFLEFLDVIENGNANTPIRLKRSV